MNGIIKIYKIFSVPMFVIAVVGYIILSYNFICKKAEEKSTWIISSAMLGAMLCVICGIAYASITDASFVIVPFYLSGAYAPLLIFECFSIYYLCKRIKERGKCKN